MESVYRLFDNVAQSANHNMWWWGPLQGRSFSTDGHRGANKDHIEVGTGT